jgi:hypothetical protein
LEEWTVTIFNVIEFVQMEADVTHRKKYGSGIEQIVVAVPVTSTKYGIGGQDCPTRMGVYIFKNNHFSELHQWYMSEKMRKSFWQTIYEFQSHAMSINHKDLVCKNVKQRYPT